MARNRYVSRMRVGASPEYYNSVSSLVAADAQTRSAAIAAQYGAMSEGISAAIKGISSGVGAYLSYSLEREKLLQDRTKLLYGMEMERLKTERESRLAELDIAKKQMDNTVLGLEVDQKQKAAIARPFVTQILSTFPGFAAEILNDPDPLSADRKLKSFRDTIQNTVINPAEAQTKGISAQIWGDERLVTAWQELQGRVFSKQESLVFIDPASKQQFDMRTLNNMLSDPNVDPELKLAAINAAQRDPRASRYGTLQQKATDEYKKLQASGDATTRAAIFMDEVRRKAPAVWQQYERDVGNGFNPASALANMKTRYQEFQTELGVALSNEKSLVGPPPAEMPKGAAQHLGTVKQAADSAWASVSQSIKSDPGGRLRWAGADEAQENAAYDVVTSGIRLAYEDAAKRMVNAKSEQEYTVARQDLSNLVTNPGSPEVRNKLLTGGFVDASKFASGPRILDPLADNLLKDGGTRWLPAGVSAAPKSVSQYVSNFGEFGNQVHNWVPSGPAAAQFGSVAEMVLQARERNGWKPLPELLKLFADEGLIVQSNIATRGSGAATLLGLGSQPAVAAPAGATVGLPRPATQATPATRGNP